MPTYLYKHTPAEALSYTIGCQDEFEIHQSIKEDALTECPTCGAKVTRLIAGNVSVTWKGGSPPTPRNYS